MLKYKFKIYKNCYFFLISYLEVNFFCIGVTKGNREFDKNLIIFLDKFSI